MTKEEARKMGATHYYQNEYITAYYFHSNDVGLWFTWNKTFKHWTSATFKERIELLKPL